MEVEDVRVQTWILGREARVEEEERPGGFAPGREGLERHVQVAGEDDGLVEVEGVAPGYGEGPVGGLVVAYALLQHPRLVGSCGLHEVLHRLVAAQPREHRVHLIQVVQRHQRRMRVG